MASFSANLRPIFLTIYESTIYESTSTIESMNNSPIKMKIGNMGKKRLAFIF